MKYEFINKHCSEFRVEKMCRVLGVSRSAYYDWLKRPESKRQQADKSLLKAIERVHKNSRETYGIRRITAQLKKDKIPCGRNRVARLMRENHIYSCHTKKYKTTTNSNHDYNIAPNLLLKDDTIVIAPKQIWVGDITYIPTDEGWLYLAAIEDVYQRKVVGWSMDSRATRKLAINALDQAVGRERPEKGLIFHSDRGVQYAAYEYQDRLRGYGIIQSMSRRGNCYDNAYAESFFSTIKKELIYRYKFRTRAEARLAIVDYIETFYNCTRLHSALDYKTPLEYEREYYYRNTA